MKATFGDYLVKKGAISAEDLAAAYVGQIKTTPSVLEIAHSRKLLDARQILETLSIQASKQTDFVSACKQAGYWTPSIEKTVWEEIGKARRSYIDKLMEQGLMTAEAFNQFFDSYLSEVAVPEVPVSATPSEAAQVFSEQFNEVARDLLFSIVEEGGDPLFLRAAVETAHRLYGAAQFSRFSRLTDFFRSLESYLSKGAGGDAKPFVLESLRAAWKLREHVLNASSEAGFETAFPEPSRQLDRIHETVSGKRENVA